MRTTLNFVIDYLRDFPGSKGTDVMTAAAVNNVCTRETARRHLSYLVETGVVLRTDSEYDFWCYHYWLVDSRVQFASHS